MVSQQAKNNQKLVKDGMDAILYQHSEELTRQYFAEDFIQHNPFSADGLDHLLVMTQFTFVWEPARWVVDGDIVAYHGMYTSTNPLDPANPLLCVDMWRIADGKIVEHWDALDVRPFGQLASLIGGGGDGLKDVPAGTVTIHKETAERFMTEALNKGNFDMLSDILADDFVHHSENGERGADSVAAWVKSMGGNVPHEIKRIIGSGDMVLTHSHFTHPDMTTATFDFFCFDEAGKIADHWSVSQAIAKPDETQNPHPHF
ncbi:MAG: nuclear transport factor 2 family protein [Chloroflexota bacterium]